MIGIAMRRIDGAAVPELDATGGKPAFASLLVDEETLLILTTCCGTSAQNSRVTERLLELGVFAEANGRRPLLRAVST